jgi:shikimate dehydrogenase
MILTGKARLSGVLGWPVSHSLSPRLQGYWLERHGVDGAYLPLPVRAEAFAGALRGLLDLGFRGANVTVPHKEAALACCDEVEPAARRIGAVNTLRFEEGRILGSNSDGFGFLESLRQGAPAWQATRGPVLLLGAGGSARAVIVALLDAGAPEIRLANRTLERAQVLAAEFGPRVRPLPWSRRPEAAEGIALLVNTTSLGLEGQPPLEMPLAALPGDSLVTDIVYRPLETELLRSARERGNPTVDGLGMLLHQARPGFEAWFGVRPEVDEALRGFVLKA